MAQRIQPPENKTENQTEDRTPILYEATVIRRNDGNYRNYSAVSFGWRCNSVIVCAAFGNVFDDDKRKGYDILEVCGINRVFHWYLSIVKEYRL